MAAYCRAGQPRRWPGSLGYEQVPPPETATAFHMPAFPFPEKMSPAGLLWTIGIEAIVASCNMLQAPVAAAAVPANALRLRAISAATARSRNRLTTCSIAFSFNRPYYLGQAIYY